MPLTMEQRDYIKRQIEQIGAVLRHIMSLILRDGNGNQESTIFEQTCKELRNGLEVDLEHLMSLDPQTTVSELQSIGFDYVLLLSFRSLIDNLADAMPDDDTRKAGMAILSSNLTSGIAKAYSTAEFQYYQ